MKSGTDAGTDFLSMYVTGRTPATPPGRWKPRPGPGRDRPGELHGLQQRRPSGDLSGINVDPCRRQLLGGQRVRQHRSHGQLGHRRRRLHLSNPLPSTDMAVTAGGPSSVVSNGAATATYTITLTNNGPNAAQGVVLSDTLPAGSTFVSMTPARRTRRLHFASQAAASPRPPTQASPPATPTPSPSWSPPRRAWPTARPSTTRPPSAPKTRPGRQQRRRRHGRGRNNDANAELGVSASGLPRRRGRHRHLQHHRDQRRA